MEHTMNRDCGESRHGEGFRHVLPFLMIPLFIGVMRHMGRRHFAQMGGMAGMHREGWKGGVPPMFAELHRRAHAAEAEAQQQPPVTEA